ncbi:MULTISPECIES: DNA cytosine methyltransferase [Prevotella]|uniref:Cytosine-specific methyltransferase n=1 Tax=Prevotella nigrescens TaxID=28133 RepID=A0A9D6A9P8_9BACT|nr:MULTISPECIES: DNA cytosine methyltransferase [Prevotella]MBF1446224.1 DNA cytosine methyltransferase [Prevotella nigrescens]
MIFEKVAKLTSKDEFLEKILIYIRLVEVIAKRKHLIVEKIKSPSSNSVIEMKDMGIIESDEDLELLSRVLGNYYSRFVSAIELFLSHKNLFGSELDKLNNRKRKEIQKREAATNKPKMVDFFAGAGGLSCGFSQAGYRVCFANDFEDVCVRTYRFNHPELPSASVLKEDIRKIVSNIDDYIHEDIDIVVGGPPCQSFSSANQRRIIDDPRNELYKYYIEAVKKICPKFVLMENVKGMLSVAGQVVEDYKSIRIKKYGKVYTYDVSYRLLNAVNFGVAQSRERLIYLAVRNDIAYSKRVTPEVLFHEIEKACEENPHYNLQSALEYIQSLDAPRIKGMTEVDDDKTGMKIGLNTFDSCGNSYLTSINSGRSIPYVFNHKARFCSDVNYEIFKRLGQGEDATNPKIADIMPYARRNGIFKDKYFKLYADRPCRTITAHLKMDCLSHIHPYQIRSITPREAARVQSFPDDYLFLGAYLKTYMQIGNAVPVLMAKQIANIIKKYI